MGHAKAMNFLREIETLHGHDARLHIFPRREFLKILGTGTSTIAALGGWIVTNADAQDEPVYSMVVVDFNKCTGCRTCEAVCSQVHDKVIVDGEKIDGLGNPRYSKIRVSYFNPPVDIPVHCMLCKDTPCIESCPVAPDSKTGRRALYRDEKTLAVKCDIERCTSCGSCARICTVQRAGAILLNDDTGKPEGICDLCDGDPACVKKCPFGALTHIKDSLDGEQYARPPEKVAEELMTLWYYHQE